MPVAPQRFYVVRDLGSSLGSPRQHRFFAWLGTRGQQGTKNDLAGFERRGFITEVDGNRVEFDYRGLNEELTAIVTPADVIWSCELLDRLPDEHWQACLPRRRLRAGHGGPVHRQDQAEDRRGARASNRHTTGR